MEQNTSNRRRRVSDALVFLITLSPSLKRARESTTHHLRFVQQPLPDGSGELMRRVPILSEGLVLRVGLEAMKKDLSRDEQRFPFLVRC